MIKICSPKLKKINSFFSYFIEESDLSDFQGSLNASITSNILLYSNKVQGMNAMRNVIA